MRAAASLGAARKRESRNPPGGSAAYTPQVHLHGPANAATGPDTGPCQYKDKSSRPFADQREGSRKAAADVAARRSEAARVVPKHVQHCWNVIHRSEWSVWTWKRDQPGQVTRRPYCCQSWRCTGTAYETNAETGERRQVNPCARYEASVTFARIKEAAEPLGGDGWCYFVLTIDREGYYGGRKWPDVTAAFRELGKLQHRFLTRLRGVQKRHGWTVTKNQWVSVVEAHRSGWPHVNVMVWCPELANELRENRARLTARGRTDREAILVGGEVLACAVNAGFGRQSTAEGARSRDALIGYITKLAGHDMGQSTAELAKITQAPTKAPERFRRLRAGKCFLPPRRKDPNITGTLVRRGRDAWGNPQVYPLHDAKPELRPMIAAVCYLEETEWLTALRVPAQVAALARPGIVSTFKVVAKAEPAGPALAWPARPASPALAVQLVLAPDDS